jgi:hypothetical protein
MATLIFSATSVVSRSGKVLQIFTAPWRLVEAIRYGSFIDAMLWYSKSMMPVREHGTTRASMTSANRDSGTAGDAACRAGTCKRLIAERHERHPGGESTPPAVSQATPSAFCSGWFSEFRAGAAAAGLRFRTGLLA